MQTLWSNRLRFVNVAPMNATAVGRYCPAASWVCAGRGQSGRRTGPTMEKGTVGIEVHKASCRVAMLVAGREAPVAWRATRDAERRLAPLRRVAMANSSIVLAMEHPFVVISSMRPAEPGPADNAGQGPMARRTGSKPSRAARDPHLPTATTAFAAHARKTIS